MTRTCTVCAHPERREIDKALVSASDPYRDIAGRYGLTRSSLMRHKADHLLPEIVAAWQEERHASGLELATEVRGWMDTIGKMLRACDEWLTDPDDAGRFTLAPHTTEVVIHTEEKRGPDRRPLRRKMKLAEALALVDGKERVGDVVLVEAKTADPRKLILDTTKTMEGHLRLVAEIAGKIQTQGATTFLVSPEWTALRGKMLVALATFPEARLALAAALDEGDARAA
jgi:hypothetical protein